MSYVLKGKTGEWEIVVGLEVHAQVISKSKLFSTASAVFGASPNAHTTFVDIAFPGMLPVANEFAIDQGIKTALGLNAEVRRVTRFSRKNYFYPDLPQGYQISQIPDEAIMGPGSIEVELENGETKTIRIEHMHMEQDAGKSVHDRNPTKTYVDLNRSGVTLMEIVSEPDIRSPEEAGAYMRKLRAILRYLGTCDGNMEEGSLRCDANVSVRPIGETKLGTRCEIKNLNSVRFVMAAIEAEAKRQIELIENGGKVVQQTRLWDGNSGTTRAMRSKEGAADYRYFPDPDLLPLKIDEARVERIRATLPELPDAKKKRYMCELGLSEYDARILTLEKENAEYFDAIVSAGAEAKLASNWVQSELFAALNKAGKEITESPVSPSQLAELISLINENVISGKIAKDVFAIMFETGDDPKKIVAEKGLVQITDDGPINEAIAKVMSENAEKVAEYKAGKVALLPWFIGQVMKATGGKANPAKTKDLLEKAMA